MNIQSPSLPLTGMDLNLGKRTPSPIIDSTSQDPVGKTPPFVDATDKQFHEAITAFIDDLIEEAVQKLSQELPPLVRKAESDKCLSLLARARDRANSRASDPEFVPEGSAPELVPRVSLIDPAPDPLPKVRLIDPAPKPFYGFGQYEPPPPLPTCPSGTRAHPEDDHPDYHDQESCQCGRHLPWSPLMGLFDKIKRGSLKKKNVNIHTPPPPPTKMSLRDIVDDSSGGGDEEDEPPYVRIVVDNNGPGPRPRASSLKGPTLGAGIDLGALARLGIPGGPRRVSFSEAVLVQGLDDHSTRFVATLASSTDEPTTPSPFLPLWESVGRNDVYRAPPTTITSGRGEVRFKAPVEFIESESRSSSESSSAVPEEEEGEGELMKLEEARSAKPGDMTRL